MISLDEFNKCLKILKYDDVILLSKFNNQIKGGGGVSYQSDFIAERVSFFQYR